MPIPSNVFNDAVRGFWNQRIAQRQAQELLGKIDQGNRRDVTGGKQMDGFALESQTCYLMQVFLKRAFTSRRV
jgi:hypothetical protein